MTKEAKIQLIRLIVVVGFSFSVLLCLAMRFLLHRGFPDSTFLFIPSDRFNDFFNLEHIRYDPYRKISITGNYFPLFYVLLIALSVAGRKLAFVVYMLGFLLFFFVYAWRNLEVRERGQTLINTLIFTFMTYPVLFVLDRANAEMWEFVLMCGFVHYFRRAEGTKSSLLLALAGSIKPFPLLFLILAVADRRWRDVVTCLAAVTALSLAALRCLGPDMIGNLRGLTVNLREYNRVFALPGDLGLYFGHSLFGLLKSVFYFAVRHHSNVSSLRPLAALCVVFAVLALLTITTYIAFVEKTFWKKVALIVLAMDLLPLVSADYKLLDFFIPLFLFLNSQQKDPQDRTYAILFALLLVPKAFYPLHGSQFSLGIVLNPILLAAMTVLIIGSGLKARRLEGGRMLPPSQGIPATKAFL